MDYGLLRYIPKRLRQAIADIFHDEDGYWIFLKQGYHVKDYYADETIHEDTIKELRRVAINYIEREVNIMTEIERKVMMNTANMIEGSINRMCVTDDLAEFDSMYCSAKRNLDKLSKMIYEARFKAESEVLK